MGLFWVSFSPQNPSKNRNQGTLRFICFVGSIFNQFRIRFGGKMGSKSEEKTRLLFRCINFSTQNGPHAPQLKNLQTAPYIIQFSKKICFSFERGDIEVRHSRTKSQRFLALFRIWPTLVGSRIELARFLILFWTVFERIRFESIRKVRRVCICDDDDYYDDDDDDDDDDHLLIQQDRGLIDFRKNSQS